MFCDNNKESKGTPGEEWVLRLVWKDNFGRKNIIAIKASNILDIAHRLRLKRPATFRRTNLFASSGDVFW
jgi:hypothetical protein